MSTNADKPYDKFDTETDDIPQGGDTVDNSYAMSDNGSGPIPVIKDEQRVEQPNDRRNPDSDRALGVCICAIIKETNLTNDPSQIKMNRKL